MKEAFADQVTYEAWLRENNLRPRSAVFFRERSGGEIHLGYLDSTRDIWTQLPGQVSPDCLNITAGFEIFFATPAHFAGYNQGERIPLPRQKEDNLLSDLDFGCRQKNVETLVERLRKEFGKDKAA